MRLGLFGLSLQLEDMAGQEVKQVGLFLRGLVLEPCSLYDESVTLTIRPLVVLGRELGGYRRLSSAVRLWLVLDASLPNGHYPSGEHVCNLPRGTKEPSCV